MTVSADYPTPVYVNGFRCKNCTDVDYAKKHIDPAHPKSGPYGIDAKADPANRSPAVTLSGSLGGANSQSNSANSGEAAGDHSGAASSGTQIDLLV